jgi:2-methylcitrate dehydratase PrpD
MMQGHPSATVLPVALALAEREHRGGADLLAAFVAGVQVAGALGALVEPEHSRRGWHPTATLGTFGATAAACHLLGLDRDAWNRAFGLAATHAGGLQRMAGTMGKPFHAGKAAMQGYFAASLAARGMTAALDVIESPRGFIDVTTPGAAPGRTLLAPTRFAIRDVLFKMHAACYLTHSAIEGVLELARTHELSPGDVERIDVQVLPVHRTTCPISTAQTGLEAKFSIEYAAAIALVEGSAGGAQFTDEVVDQPQVRELAARVVRHEGDRPRSQMAGPDHPPRRAPPGHGGGHRRAGARGRDRPPMAAAGRQVHRPGDPGGGRIGRAGNCRHRREVRRGRRTWPVDRARQRPTR